MKTPIVLVHGIGKLKDEDTYYKHWHKYKWKFDPAFYNASWHPDAFNITASCFDREHNMGFKALTSLNHEARKGIPLMLRMAFYMQSKLRALKHYAKEQPYWKRAITATVDRLLFRLLGVECLDFVGDVLSYLQWEEYTVAEKNPIKESVRKTIETALKDFPDRPVHIVCHSLGTKIVWDILNEMRDLPQGRIGVLMTMSSPLEPLAIFGWTRPEDNTAYVKPNCVDHWLNVYDVRDVIGAPIGSASFRRKDGVFLTHADVMLVDPMPCANVCTQIGLFPWSAHIAAWKAKDPKRLFSKYLKKYIS